MYRLISVENAADWSTALRGVRHTVTHTNGFCKAMADSSGLETYLFVLESNAGNRSLCPISFRYREPGAKDIVSPYGFGGFTDSRVPGLVQKWAEFVRSEGVVTAYIQNHPSTYAGTPVEWIKDFHEGSNVFLVDLRQDIETLWAKLGKTHRYEIRRNERSAVANLTWDQNALKDSFFSLYINTMIRVGASETYNFKLETIQNIYETLPGFMVGMVAFGKIEAISWFIYNQDVGEYFLNASSVIGRDYSRCLLWEGMKELKKRGVGTVNLGGGIQNGDFLELFKKRFGGRQSAVPVLKQIFDNEKYQELLNKYTIPSLAGADYFPEYWAKIGGRKNGDR